MKVLLITYYWPPAGGSGVQRWLKFVKYMSEFGIDPIVFTVDDPSYTIEDPTLLGEVPEKVEIIRQSLWEPNQLLSKLNKGGKQESAGFLKADPSFIERQMHYIRANYFIPDARKYWVKPSVKRLLTFLKEHPVDLMISTGPPHSAHLIACELKRKTGVKWVADFRDPWTNIDYFQNLPLSQRSRQKHHDLEDEVLRQADAVLVVGKTMKEEFLDRNEKVYVLSNGYDDSGFEDETALDAKFTISHIGMMNADRNPVIFWKALSELVTEHEDLASDLSVKLIGKCDQVVYQSVKEFKLSSYVNFIAYVAHKDVLAYQRASQVLLLAVNNVPSAKSVVTGKVFEYLQSKRPILGIGPLDGDLADILEETSSGHMVDFNDLEAVKKVLLDYYRAFKKEELVLNSKGVEKYHRKSLTKKLAAILKDV